MIKIYELLDSYGLYGEADIPSIGEMDAAKVRTLSERLFDTTFDAQDDPNELQDQAGLDPFTFLASASIRGDSSCWEPACRSRKLDFLGRFSALYANQVTLPLLLGHQSESSSLEYSRTVLSLTVMSLLRLRPVIYEGIVRPVVMRSKHCVHVAERVEEMSVAARNAGDYFARKIAKEFIVTFQLPEKSPSGRSTVYVEGPEEFLEHGSIVFLFDESKDWRAKSWKFDSEGKVSLKGERKLFFVQKIMRTVANNTSFYLAYGLLNRAQFLTDLPGETFLLEGMNTDEQVSANSKAMQALDHTLPILADFSLDEILRIRREDRASFAAYREAIATTTADVFSRPISQEEAEQLFRQKIEPQLSKIQREIVREREKQLNRVAAGIGSLVAGVGIGAFAGLPLLAAAPIAALGAAIGGKVLSKAVEHACEHGADMKQQNDLYFLVELLNEGADQ